MDNTVIIVICTTLTAYFTALPSNKNSKQKKDIAETKKDISEIKQILGYRKEENSIAFEAAEAALEAVMTGKTNGKCKKAKDRIDEYQNRCLAHRL